MKLAKKKEGYEEEEHSDSLFGLFFLELIFPEKKEENKKSNMHIVKLLQHAKSQTSSTYKLRLC